MRDTTVIPCPVVGFSGTEEQERDLAGAKFWKNYYQDLRDERSCARLVCSYCSLMIRKGKKQGCTKLSHEDCTYFA